MPARKKFARREDLGLTKAEFAVLRRLDSPEKIRRFLYGLAQNFELRGETCATVRTVLQVRRAHCIEGAMLAACAFWVHGEPPVVLDLRAVHDFDHVVALYRRNGLWGAISKTNGFSLRSRDPVYRSVRELALSYFHEYCNGRHRKTLREFSAPFDLRRMDPSVWVSGEEDCWSVADALDEARHFRLVPARALRDVARRDRFEQKVGAVLQYRDPRKKRKRTKNTAKPTKRA